MCLSSPYDHSKAWDKEDDVDFEIALDALRLDIKHYEHLVENRIKEEIIKEKNPLAKEAFELAFECAEKIIKEQGALHNLIRNAILIRKEEDGSKSDRFNEQ